MTKLTQRKTSGRESGIALVEMALLIFLLGIILMGTIDFGRLFYSAVTVTDAARAGAQYGAQGNTHTSDSSGMTQAAAEDAVNIEGFSSSIERFCKCQSGSSVDCVTGTCAEGAPQIYVRVRGENTFQTLVHFPGIPDTVSIGQEATIRVQ